MDWIGAKIDWIKKIRYFVHPYSQSRICICIQYWSIRYHILNWNILEFFNLKLSDLSTWYTI